MKKISFLAVILLLSVSAFAILPPGNIQAAFKKMYPKANGIAWSQDDGYYCANFVMNGFTKNVWFNTQAQWQMTQTDLVSLDRVTPTVYNAFVSGPYASWVVNDVTMVEFPKWQAIIVIKVGQDNVDIKYQLFLFPARNVAKNPQCQLYVRHSRSGNILIKKPLPNIKCSARAFLFFIP